LASLAVDVLGGTLTAPFEAHVVLAKEAGLTTEELHAGIRILAEFSVPKAWEAFVALKKLA
jgi:alkylhydroperoxidase/carboxymuconolactone decarboxylase family protein YurZ